MRKYFLCLALCLIAISSQATVAHAAVWQTYGSYGSSYNNNSYGSSRSTYGVWYLYNPTNTTYTCLYKNSQGECMVEQYFDPRNVSYRSQNYAPVYSQRDLYNECRDANRSRSSRSRNRVRYDCDYYLDYGNDYYDRYRDYDDDDDFGSDFFDDDDDD